MSTAYIRNTVLIYIGAVLSIILVNYFVFSPLLGIIQNLSDKTTSFHKVTVYPNWLTITAAAVASCISLAAVISTAKGYKQAQSNRWMWIVALIIGILMLVYAASITISAPNIQMLFKGMGCS